MADPDPIRRTDASTERMAPAGDPDGDPLAGTGYRALALIGGGAHSLVYRAEHIKLESIVVVKIMRQALADAPAVAERMRVEAQTLARIAHDNVVSVVDFGVVQRRPFLVMDYLIGRTLREELAARRQLPVAEVVDLARQMLAGLQAVHDGGLVHRDLHPGNVYLCETELGSLAGERRTVKLLDFGGLKLLGGSEQLGVAPSSIPTADGIQLGHPRYCAPEQMTGKAVDATADVYAVAAILYRAVAGREPYAGREGLSELLRAKLSAPPDAVSRYAAQLLPHALDRLIMQALSVDPAERPPSARAMRESLRRIAEAARIPWAPEARPASGAAAGRASEPSANGPWLRTETLEGDVGDAGEGAGADAAAGKAAVPADARQISGERRIAEPADSAPAAHGALRESSEARLLKPGQPCGPYEIVREIGRGAMGVVYLANNADGEPRAIKLLQLTARIRRDLADRFKREIQLLSYVDHVHVVRFYEAGVLQLGGKPTLWVALEYLAGKTLREIVTEQGGELGVERYVRWGRQIAQGVHEVHKLGVTHRDLKPENISIVQGDIAKVFDFGIAKYRAWGVRATDMNHKLGTLPYMSPEQLDGSVQVDARTDVFALGLILHELATGRHPFIDLREHIDLHEAIMRQVTMPAVRLDEVVQGFPTDVADIVDRAVAKQPDHRFASMAELADALGAAIRRMRSEARAVALDTGIGPASAVAEAAGVRTRSPQGHAPAKPASPAFASPSAVAEAAGPHIPSPEAHAPSRPPSTQPHSPSPHRLPARTIRMHPGDEDGVAAQASPAAPEAALAVEVAAARTTPLPDSFGAAPPPPPAARQPQDPTALHARVRSGERAASARTLMLAALCAVVVGALGYLAVAFGQQLWSGAGPSGDSSAASQTDPAAEGQPAGPESDEAEARQGADQADESASESTQAPEVSTTGAAEGEGADEDAGPGKPGASATETSAPGGSAPPHSATSRPPQPGGRPPALPFGKPRF